MYFSVNVDNVGLTSGQMTISYIEGSNQYRSIINHNKIENISVMANVYHHWKSDSFSFSPYVGIEVGRTKNYDV